MMFEFYVFQAGGLVLWPIDCDPTKKTITVVNEYIQKQLLEGKLNEDVYVKDKMACLVTQDPAFNIFVAVTLHQQVAQQINYLSKLLEDVCAKFTHQYQQILKRSDVMLTPNLFDRFTVDDVVDKYRGTVGIQINQPKITIADLDDDSYEEPNKKAQRSKSEPGRKKSPSKERIRYTSKSKENIEEQSTVVGLEEVGKVERIEVKQYNMDDFTGVFQANPNANKSFFSGILSGIVGEKSLDIKTLEPFLKEFESHLISKNVASAIAHELTTAVGQKLDGTKCGTFQSVKTVVMATLREQIERILTPHRSIDIIRDIQLARKQGKPYVFSFIGVNGVGKSTTLAKVAYLMKSHDFKVLIVGCDTFRSGAVKQLAEHAERLGIELFQRGNDRRDPVPVAKDAIQYAIDKKIDVVLVDTAGRMQNSEGLMKQIARLINEVKPDLSLFVAEALVGGNGSDQISSFDMNLKRYAGVKDAKGIDGIVLTKFDTIDDKVGAALTLVYETGHPIIYLGVGQTYRDLRRMNPEFVVNTLLSGF
ncbi:SRP54-type protein, putative [Trichomonas vaginalis G3]|uniref:Signal recognition particle receptor subunit alpha homolog n=1 Tax=Trichomonas vaginalis (strain ATCC PRA-98 / G3) TaxID=412133 RepID=A2EHQ0_TRIV3|nr:signal recognition particle receptor subunit alpha family [Trichomonas vaginalis G3]EAY07846.1 SRP54-type protein, putative [Trichomonas vaginalis G3]KAI5553458.1 signal recognition particle receptor subunit alpha family [Trichomonas vaginalis G3]|eukprot:XP_001320069.1 SRP54-type protein [Trichomonas vaginalis G3]